MKHDLALHRLAAQTQGESPDFHLDYETRSEIDLKKVGLDVYSSHPSTRVQMVAWAWGDGEVKQWDEESGEPFPQEVIDALLNPAVTKWAFNAQFERVITRRVLKIKTPYQGWRCTMTLAYMQSFVGNLEQIGSYVGLPTDQQKLKRGKLLLNLFAKPRTPTKNNPLRWRDAWTHPEEWEEYKLYNRQDVIAERGIKKRLIKFPILDSEWELYEIDQRTNDRGLPIDMQFVRSAIKLANRRKGELTAELVELTKLANPNSPAQLTPWLKERGYPFEDLRKDTVQKVLNENEAARLRFCETWGIDPKEEGASEGFLTPEAVEALKLRQNAARTSVKKYDRLLLACVGARMRFGFQFCGAQRTGRAAGRIINPQNLTRTPKEIEPDPKRMEALGVPGDYLLALVTQFIRDGDYDMLSLTMNEVLDALAGTVRSAIRASDGYKIIACDLSSIETCSIGYLSGCERLMNVFRNGLDPYIDFGADLYNKKYEEVTKRERQDAKPAVLGAGFRLGGGELRDGKRGGLWGYAESMGVDLTQEQAAKAVALYRESYPEVPKLWYALEEAAEDCVRTGMARTPMIRRPDGSKFRVPVTFEMKAPYLTIVLPSGRRMYYHKPRLHKEKRRTRPTEEHPEGREYTKTVLSYMGREQGKGTWKRINTHGGKLTENIVQAFARDVLMAGYRRAVKEGFKIIGHVHDELIALVKVGDNRLTGSFLRELMIFKDPWMGELPLNAAASEYDFYRKD